MSVVLNKDFPIIHNLNLANLVLANFFQLLILPFLVCRYGLDSLPVSWLDKYPRLSEVVGYIETVAKL